jgi:hypothetical protein
METNNINPEDFNVDEYGELFNKNIDELKHIAVERDIPDPDEFDKEELVMAIELADLAEQE